MLSQFIEKIAIQPSTDYLLLLKYLLILLIFIHLAFISLVIGFEFVSVFLNLLGRKRGKPAYFIMAKDLMDTVLFNKLAVLILGILPLILITFDYSFILYNSPTAAVNLLSYSIIPLILGFIFLYTYRFTFHIGSGVISIFFFLIVYLVFIGSTTLIIDPEKWEFIKKPAHLIFSWNVISRYLQFLITSFAVTGGGIILFFNNYNGRKGEDYILFVKRLGLWLMLVFAFLQPPVILWDIILLPKVTFSIGLFFLKGVTLILYMGICLIAYTMLVSLKKNWGLHAFILFLLTFAITGISEHIMRENALRGQTIFLSAKVKEAVGVKDRGEEIYNEICAGCHSFTEEIVGPPFMTVLTKYKDRKEELKAYIRKPVKKDPAYPEMPQLDMKEEEIDAVAEFLLKNVS